MSAKPALTFFHALPSGAVDQTAGTISGVSVLTVGPALGHGIQIDRMGLEQCLAACQARGNVKLIDRHDAEFDGIVGAISNFRIEGDQVKGDVSLLDTHPMRGRVLEIAAKLSSEFGLSIECDNKHVDNPNGEGKLFRCTDVDAVALVPRPASNKTGLFSAVPFDTQKKVSRKAKPKFMSALKTALSKFASLAKFEEGDELDNVLDAIVSAVQDQQPSVEDRLKKLEEGAAPKAEPTDEEKAKLAEDEKFAEDEKAKADEEKMQKLAAKIADERITKFTAEIGLKRAPGSAGGFALQDDNKTKLASELAAQKAAGAKSDGDAILKLSRNKPEVYNEFRKLGIL